MGFTDPHIEMFLERYNIDPTAEVDDEQLRRLSQIIGKTINKETITSL